MPTKKAKKATKKPAKKASVKKTSKKSAVKKPVKKTSRKTKQAKPAKKVVVVAPVVDPSGVVTMNPVADDLLN